MSPGQEHRSFILGQAFVWTLTVGYLILLFIFSCE